jgi:hypothetical protein
LGHDNRRTILAISRKNNWKKANTCARFVSKRANAQPKVQHVPANVQHEIGDNADELY